MAIYPPEVHLSKNDKRLLQLLARLLLDAANIKFSDNIPSDQIILTDKEAKKLIELIDSLLNSKEFLFATSFINELSAFPLTGEGRMKDIYLTGLSELGKKSTQMSFYRWNEFKARLGLFNLSVVGNKPISPMRYSYFLKMEEILFKSFDIDPLVMDLLMRTVEGSEKKVLKSLKEANLLPGGIIRGLMTKIKETASSGISQINVASAITFISNSSVIFTTRDWGVAGTLSCMAAAAATFEKRS